MISPLSSILTLIFAYRVFKKITKEGIALYALVFLAFTPMFIDYSIYSYVEALMLLFVVLSVYYALKNKVWPSAVFVGLGILTKYNAGFILPVLAFIIYNNDMENRQSRGTALWHMVVLCILPLLVALPWLIRNWINLGNPVWPFLNAFFQGAPYPILGSGFDLSNLIDPRLPSRSYLAFFGVPEGNPANLSFAGIPYMNIMLALWIGGTILFLAPLFFSSGFRDKASKKLAWIWVLSYFVLYLVYVVTADISVMRTFLPAVPALAIFWAYGFGNLMAMLEKARNHKFLLLGRKLGPGTIAFILLGLIIAGFIIAASVKILVADKAWGRYAEDFEWAQKNTPANALFMAGGQCTAYNLDRLTIQPAEADALGADYLFVNQGFALDNKVKISQEMLDEIEASGNIFQLAYSNPSTGTRIFKNEMQ